MPILNEDHKPVAAMSIAGPQVRFNERQLDAVSGALMQAASVIQAQTRYPQQRVGIHRPAAGEDSQADCRTAAPRGTLKFRFTSFATGKQALWLTKHLATAYFVVIA